MIRVVAAALVLAVLSLPLPGDAGPPRVGSKKFTESVVLGEAIRLLAAHEGVRLEHQRELGGSRLLFEALRAGEIVAYPEYTGTLLAETLAARGPTSVAELEHLLAEDGIAITRPLGFNNTYALGMLRSRADELGVETFDDLLDHPGLRFAFSNEFMDRADGWPGLREAYGFRPASVTGVDHDIAYTQLRFGQVDVIDVYTTDARIDALDLAVLDDDRGFFPRYDAVILHRRDAPGLAPIVERPEGRIPAERMTAANAAVEIDGLDEAEAARLLLRDTLGVEVAAPAPPDTRRRVTARFLEHLDLVRRSLLPAILLGIPLGVLAAGSRWAGRLILGATGIVQTIPSLALLVLLIPLASALGLASVGAGSWTAVVALFLYSLLPIVRGTEAGLASIDPALEDSAVVLGLSRATRLVRIRLPLAARSILSGVKTAAVMNVGFATLGALVGAGGFGQPILTGIRLADGARILEGAIPAALFALAAQGLFDGVERAVVSPGLRRTARQDRARGA